MGRNSNACRIERSLQAHTETEYVEEDRCYPPPEGSETSPRSKKACSLEEKQWFRLMRCKRWTVGSQPTTPHTGRNYRVNVGRYKSVEEGNIDVRKREIKADGQEFLERA